MTRNQQAPIKPFCWVKGTRGIIICILFTMVYQKSIQNLSISFRDFRIKRRGLHGAEDRENQNPNLSTPVNQHVRSLKAAIKSSSEKKKPVGELSRVNEAPGLKSTLSARNLFARRSILSQITDFVGELKKLASRTKEREGNVEKLNAGKNRGDTEEEGNGELLKMMGTDTKGEEAIAQ
ncbi:hypothetical protein SAY86_012338 [Trapa natans]|uniref:Uncharacterized protein n=1 Tax=Trapa natans TaxID=22666 RepID=A0AAN7R713_TRANT|nr:hypothetical protein SAY86_012338 [Trapa natans]